MSRIGKKPIELANGWGAIKTLGARTALLTLSQGEAILSHVFDSWRPDGGRIPRRSNGVLVSDRSSPRFSASSSSLSQ